ncbi:hypothetical protein BGZ52_004631 [Haplosporangium bisporale]|nr:hypothetical protein BGZ52_004631 [Haplosporangium bisporale]
MLVSDTDLVYAAGDNKMGQLGNKTNSQYLQQSNRLVHILQTNPVHMALLKYKVIIQVACSANKTLALDTEGMVFSWGFGGYMTVWATRSNRICGTRCPLTNSLGRSNLA